MPASDGLLVVDKPADWTSHDVVAFTRRLAGTRKVGHAGTLDPMATGVLLLGIGRCTRLLTFLVGCDKAYTATIRLGEATVTDDAQGEVIASPGAEHLDRAAIEVAAAALTGRIEQVPSAVSAIKVDGRRAYARVRGGEQVELAARPVTVSRFEVGDLRRDGRFVEVDVEVSVSSGTYVRALARDLGSGLGSAGHLTALRRTRVGRYDLTRAHPLADLAAIVEKDGTTALPVLPLADAARAQFEVRELTEAQARAVSYGQPIDSAQPGRPDPVAAFAPDGTLVAMIDETGANARARVVFAAAGA